MKCCNELKDICIKLDYEKLLFDFYSLFFALDDLEYSENQLYWQNATRKTIDSIISEYFKNRLKEQDEYRYQMIDR